jgi:ABC-type lipoprotein export system ATPase subunit
MSNPRVLLADEPTGNLDEERGQEIMRLLRDLNTRDGLTIIMVTHNMDLVAPTDRVVRLVKGRVEEGADRAGVVLPLPPAGEGRQHPAIDPRIDTPRRKAL